MARPVNTFRTLAEVQEETTRQRIDRTTARALAAAVASLAVATFVVSTSTSALDPGGTVAGNSFESGTVALVDDDGGRSLVRLENMAPRRPVERCITITYDGTILPVDVTLQAQTDGDIAEFVTVQVEQGEHGGYDSCDGFESHEYLYAGNLDELASSEPLPVGAIRNEGGAMTFRFTFELLDDGEAAGRSGSLDFLWEAVPS